MKDLIFFSGSGARIASHLGAANYLDDQGIEAKYYGGISGGAIIATFLALGIIPNVREQVLSITSKDVFFPPIFNSRGKIRPIMAALGWACYGPSAIADNFPLQKSLQELHVARARWERFRPANLFIYLYQKGKGITKFYSTGKNWDEWVCDLVLSASIPMLSKSGEYSDAGIVRQLPLPSDSSPSSLAFITAQRQPTEDLAEDILRRVALDNIMDEEKGFPGQIIYLPAANTATQYDAALMRESFRASYQAMKTISIP